MTDKPTRRYQLCVDRLETLDDVKKVLDMMQLRIQTDDPDYEEVKDYFCLEVVPRGYIKLLQKIGQSKINEMNWDEMEIEASKLLSESETENEEKS
jgi:hypothetical protein